MPAEIKAGAMIKQQICMLKPAELNGLLCIRIRPT